MCAGPQLKARAGAPKQRPTSPEVGLGRGARATARAPESAWFRTPMLRSSWGGSVGSTESRSGGPMRGRCGADPRSARGRYGSALIRPQIDHVSGLVRPRIDPGSTSFPPQLDHGSVLDRPPIDPRWTADRHRSSEPAWTPDRPQHDPGSVFNPGPRVHPRSAPDRSSIETPDRPGTGPGSGITDPGPSRGGAGGDRGFRLRTDPGLCWGRCAVDWGSRLTADPGPNWGGSGVSIDNRPGVDVGSIRGPRSSSGPSAVDLGSIEDPSVVDMWAGTTRKARMAQRRAPAST